MTLDLLAPSRRVGHAPSRPLITMPSSVELFTGGGGLALGVRRAGFEHLYLIEFDAKACQTIHENNKSGVLAPAWPIDCADIHGIDFTPLRDDVDLLAAGVPCQPFSMAGRHLGDQDDRNLFPQALRAVREIRPRIVFFENVKGLVRPSFFSYFEYVLWQLEMPELTPHREEDWEHHKARLAKARGRSDLRLTYRVEYRLVNAADYGVPQRRDRVVVVALRDDLAGTWSWPNPTHSYDALLFAQWVDKSYWAEHDLRPRRLPTELRDYVKGLATAARPPYERWRTVRDALRGLPPPGRSSAVLNHDAVPGARRYKGHTGSPLDEPAKTLKAGVHGVPGGEGTVLLDNGSVRYFTIREAARLQTFPDDFAFYGARSHAMRQIGNAVPVALAELFAKRLRRALG